MVISNLLISIFGKFDDHFNPLWEHGHIKFWSVDPSGFKNYCLEMVLKEQKKFIFQADSIL